MKCFIIAIDHGWQLEPWGLETPEIVEAKVGLGALLRRVIVDRGVDVICEESDPCRVSIAQKIAYEYEPRVSWKNISMSAQERLEAGIWEALFNRPGHTIEDPAGTYRTIDHRIPEDDTRERFFAREVIQAANAVGAKSILVLCGHMHAGFLQQILEAGGCQAETDGTLIPRKYWQ